jgi:adenylyltransferase/sulfurtransferase
MIALVQATETVKLLAGLGRSLAGRLLHYDALDLSWREFKMQKDPDCPICGTHPEITELIDYEGFCGMPAREESESLEVAQISAAGLAARIDRGEELFLLDVREAEEVEAARIEGSHWIPLGDLEARIGELIPFKERRIVVHCRSGARSTKAARLLLERGFRQVENLDGGIQAWSLTVDSSVPQS